MLELPKVSEDHLTALSTYAPRVSAFTPLRYRDFRLLWTGLVIANIGSWMQFVALGYLVDRLTKEPLYLGILAASQAVPRLLFALEPPGWRPGYPGTEIGRAHV